MDAAPGIGEASRSKMFTLFRHTAYVFMHGNVITKAREAQQYVDILNQGCTAVNNMTRLNAVHCWLRACGDADQC